MLFDFFLPRVIQAAKTSCPPLSRDNRVEVCFWEMRIQNAASGHVALKVVRNGAQAAYLSLWPDHRKLAPAEALIHGVPVLFHTYEEDVAEEGRAADHRLAFYHVNFPHVLHKIQRLREDRLLRWRGPGDVSGHHHNCSTSVAYVLEGCLRSDKDLQLGVWHGVGSLPPTNSKALPINLRKALEKAKRGEERVCPETKKFDRSNGPDTPPASFLQRSPLG